MDWNESDVRRNRDYFQWKLHAIKQRADVVKAIEQGTFDFRASRHARSRGFRLRPYYRRVVCSA